MLNNKEGKEQEVFMKKALYSALAVVLAVGLFTACTGSGHGNNLTVEDPVESMSSGQPEASVDPPQMETEEQLRKGLAALQDKPETQAERLAFYEELLARDMCREEDYLELAQLYADAGDGAAQRRMLWWAFRLYPSEESARRLQELVLQRTEEEPTAEALVTALQQALTERDAAAFRTVIQGEDWREIFQEAPEIYATSTRYTAGNLTAQIVSDSYETEVFLLSADGACLYGRLNDAGSLIGSAVCADGAYNGDAEVCWFDGDGSLYKKYQAVLRNDVCVNNLSVEYEGVIYKGALGEDGSTKEEQQEKVTQAGGVVYAYQEGGRRYLYQEGTTKESFRMDCERMGLPRVDIWE